MFANGLRRAVWSMLVAPAPTLAAGGAGNGRPAKEEPGQRRVVMVRPSDLGPPNPVPDAPNLKLAPGLVYGPLARLAADGSFGSWLTASRNISPDGRVHSFRLPRDVRLSNSETFDAAAAATNANVVLAARPRVSRPERADAEKIDAAIDAALTVTGVGVRRAHRQRALRRLLGVAISLSLDHAPDMSLAGRGVVAASCS